MYRQTSTGTDNIYTYGTHAHEWTELSDEDGHNLLEQHKQTLHWLHTQHEAPAGTTIILIQEHLGRATELSCSRHFL